jgi:hypothetical protein
VSQGVLAYYTVLIIISHYLELQYLFGTVWLQPHIGAGSSKTFQVIIIQELQFTLSFTI